MSICIDIGNGNTATMYSVFLIMPFVTLNSSDFCWWHPHIISPVNNFILLSTLFLQTNYHICVIHIKTITNEMVPHTVLVQLYCSTKDKENNPCNLKGSLEEICFCRPTVHVNLKLNVFLKRGIGEICSWNEHILVNSTFLLKTSTGSFNMNYICTCKVTILPIEKSNDAHACTSTHQTGVYSCTCTLNFNSR